MLHWKNRWLKQHWNKNLNTDRIIIEIIIILRFESKCEHPLPLHTWLLPKVYYACIPYISSFYWCKVTIVISRFENWSFHLDFRLTFFHSELYFVYLDTEKITALHKIFPTKSLLPDSRFVFRLQDSNKLKDNGDFARNIHQKSTQNMASNNFLKKVQSSWCHVQV